MHAPDSVELRRLALAVSVLDDVDIVPTDDGVLLTGDAVVEVSWLELRRALAGADPESDLGRARVSGWLRGRRIAADTHPDHLRGLARPVGLPVDHPLHPGLDWVRHRVLGDVLDLGFGFVGVGDDPDEVVVVPQGALDAAGIDPLPWWPVARDYLERMGAVAAQRLADTSLLRPIGDCDVVTLLGSRALREALCALDGTGMRAAAVPMRRRGWLDLTRIDPAFTTAAAAATAPDERGFSRPLLLTADEVTMAPDGGRPAEIVLRDKAVETPHLRPMLFR
ncbi:MAG TPA: hypothetical protein VFV76_14125 [Actinomycetes bacterium]|nr:hypothetical protein [Actinomycetes bacterium]